ncbi:hypothetical protein FEM48_Zijuj02G0143000 [Ziziphus jujuba var. spinosa]|uniref:RanBP2-type domain-containing protein n=1 Tax=Ziziphus jujuba var. spinosa TaxID=714518 RepID=A0A978VW64_ZIZJJ|nr:hypothetical protein FEM48_Zijuj02G0143000 [Ziziphus jujuba var. spinosa]
MAQTPFSLLILRRLSLPASSNPKSFPSVFHLLTTTTTKRFYSTSPTPTSFSSSSSSDTKPQSSLSARLSFVFDQIDAIEKERSQKDETLQRIRAWRESKKAQQQPDSGLGFATDATAKDLDSNYTTSASAMADAKSKPVAESDRRMFGVKNEVELVHPWPEWIELMERLVQQNYFDHRRKDEDKMVQELGFDAAVGATTVSDASGLDFKDFKTVQTACLNFGKDRFDIMRSLSRQDIQILVGFGCPSADKKVVFSAKLLRKHVHLDEGDVCSTCSLRNSCERAYLITNKEDEARTIDIMRVLLAYGFDPSDESVNKSVLKQKSVKTVVRKLLHEVVKLSSVPIDPNLPPPVIKKPPPKVKQPPPPPKKRVGRDDIEMKKGDWLCPKCDFMNFAKNTVCLQCDAKRPKRQLLPGEWECPQCNFLNYRRNTECFHCECKRPPDEFMENKIQEKRHGPMMRLERVANQTDFSNAWNFDFDDNESDGADVAAFEYADSSKGESSPLDNHAQGNLGRPGYEYSKGSRVQSVHDEEFSDTESGRPGTGFDDFDDEEDDIDSYELDTSNRNSAYKVSSIDFSDLEDAESHDTNLLAHHRTKTPFYSKQSKSTRQRAAFSGSDDDELDFDSNKELPAHPKWKSSHVADQGPRGRNRGRTGPSKGLSFGSDDEVGLYSDVDGDSDEDFRSKRGKTNKLGSGRRDFGRRGTSDVEDDLFSGSESENDDRHSHRNKIRGNKAEFSKRGNNSKGLGNHSFTRETKSRPNGMKGGGRNSFDEDYDGFSQGHRGNKGDNSKGFGNRSFRRETKSRPNGMKGGRRNSFDDDDSDGFSQGHRGNRGFRGDRDAPRIINKGGNMQKFKGPRREGFQGARHKDYDRDMDRDFGEFRNSRRIIER